MKIPALFALLAATHAAFAATVLSGDGFLRHPDGGAPKCDTSFRIDARPSTGRVDPYEQRRKDQERQKQYEESKETNDQ